MKNCYSIVCKTYKFEMPQLVPFYFVNEITFTFVIIAFTIYILSKYFLPRSLRSYYTDLRIVLFLMKIIK